MKTTITLSVDVEIAERVKQIKAETGTFPSHIFTEAIKSFNAETPPDNTISILSKLRSVIGKYKLVEPVNSKNTIEGIKQVSLSINLAKDGDVSDTIDRISKIQNVNAVIRHLLRDYRDSGYKFRDEVITDLRAELKEIEAECAAMDESEE